MKESLQEFKNRYNKGMESFKSGDIFNKTDLPNDEKEKSESLIFPEFYQQKVKVIDELGTKYIWQCFNCKKLFTTLANAKEPECKCAKSEVICATSSGATNKENNSQFQDNN